MVEVMEEGVSSPYLLLLPFGKGLALTVFVYDQISNLGDLASPLFGRLPQLMFGCFFKAAWRFDNFYTIYSK